MAIDERTETTASGGIIGIAQEQGRQGERLRSLEQAVADLRRQVSSLNDYARRVENARVEMGNRQNARLADHDGRLAALEAKPAAKPGPAPVATVPVRREKESNSEFSKRLVVWANTNNKTAPPKPGALMTTADYDRAVKSWTNDTANSKATVIVQ